MSARVIAVVAALAAVTVGLVALPASGAPGPQEKQSFIVVLRDSVSNASPVAAEHAHRFGADVTYVYNEALKGYAARMAPGQLAGLQADARVASVERDGEMTATATTQSGATWGLDRIDQHTLPLSGTFTYTSTGTAVKAYVIDTGIRTTHSQFAGRAINGADTVDGSLPAADCNGHGTHVAGTIGGSAFGVAKSVTLVAVRVLDCNGSGSVSGVIAGINWVTADHQAGQPAVANMSLGGSGSTALDTAVRNSIADGVSYAVAAGNGNPGGIAQDACKSSPARVGEAMTVGATSSNDAKASWSNYGTCVDWFAPGVSITSAWNSSDTATNTISGTSMATPHTTGVAALYLQNNAGASPATVRNALYAKTTKGVVISSKTANNHLLFSDY